MPKPSTSVKYTLHVIYIFNIDFQLVVICSRETEDQSRLVTALDSNRVANTVSQPPEEIRRYLQNHFIVQPIRSRIVPAATLDPEG